MHRVEKRLELPTGASRINRALKGVEKIHVDAGHRPRMRRPVSWETLLGGQPLTVSWGPGGRVLWLCLALSYFLLARSEEIFASSASGIHPVHCLQRNDVTFLDSAGRVLQPLQWHRATRVEVHFRGHKGDQA